MNKLCDECETVAHCTKHGCIPKQPAPVLPDYKQLYEQVCEQYDVLAKEFEAIKQALAAPVQEPVAQAWDEGYRAGIDDERTSEANIGIAGFDAKVEPARNNPYRTTPPAQPAVPDALFRHAPEHPEYIQGWNDCRAEMLSMRKRVKP